jgi:hypothetical protein
VEIGCQGGQGSPRAVAPGEEEEEFKRNPVIPPLLPLKFLKLNLNISCKPLPILMKLDIMPHEDIAMVYVINASPQ